MANTFNAYRHNPQTGVNTHLGEVQADSLMDALGKAATTFSITNSPDCLLFVRAVGADEFAHLPRAEA